MHYDYSMYGPTTVHKKNWITDRIETLYECIDFFTGEMRDSFQHELDKRLEDLKEIEQDG